MNFFGGILLSAIACLATAKKGGWGDKAVRCPKEFEACEASGKPKKECVASFLNCLMEKKSDDVLLFAAPFSENQSGWGDKAVRCPKEFKACETSGKPKKECVASFLNCLMETKSGDVAYDSPVVDDDSGWGNKAVRCPKEFKECEASGKLKKECVASFLNCLMEKKSEDVAYDIPVINTNDGWGDKAVRCPKEFKACETSGKPKKECVASFLNCLMKKKSDFVIYDAPAMPQQYGIVQRTAYCTKRLAKCIVSGSIKKRVCATYYAMCMTGSEEQ